MHSSDCQCTHLTANALIWLPMHQLQRSWVRSQHPSAQWNLRGGRWSRAGYSMKEKEKIPPKKNIRYNWCVLPDVRRSDAPVAWSRAAQSCPPPSPGNQLTSSPTPGQGPGGHGVHPRCRPPAWAGSWTVLGPLNVCDKNVKMHQGYSKSVLLDPDPRSGAFLTPGSGIRIRDEQPGSYFLELRNHFLG